MGKFNAIADTFIVGHMISTFTQNAQDENMLLESTVSDEFLKFKRLTHVLKLEHVELLRTNLDERPVCQTVANYTISARDDRNHEIINRNAATCTSEIIKTKARELLDKVDSVNFFIEAERDLNYGRQIPFADFGTVKNKEYTIYYQTEDVENPT